MAEDYQDVIGGITAPQGFLAAGVEVGIKSEGRDVALIYSQNSAKVAAVFTTNQCSAAPVKLSRENCEDGLAQAIVVNSGNANACTGKRGWSDAERMEELAAEELNLKQDQILVASTGIIGEFLEMNKVEEGIKKAAANLSETGSAHAAEAIMTTDTYSKELAVEVEIGGETVTIGGIAKGSGMIEPNMATMLSFLTTDLAIDAQLLDQALRKAVNNSFNKIIVDGDQSTNDMVSILANGQAGNSSIQEQDQDYEKFVAALQYVTKVLAHQIVLDGEGATKFVEVEVAGARNKSDAEVVARKIANSNLVKTALFGEDPNWGRIVAAVGASGIDIDLAKLEIRMNDLLLLDQDETVLNYEEELEELLTTDEIKLKVNLNLGEAVDRVWTCDLSYEYVEINGEYHT
ncbi:bifunctional glutamate N-acetyltransferase/amino-acid acetyltransferase ArgJ [Natroniella sulfidigena]|uniref:bifunctional glutamate N-acetyltransferase/amino-acid acetyltransferase ArgJ n=1 Tax=Natroniella sulfidigena TaxID=723921 RepID=UPI00200B4586|nr:bifunctional glutamate N-acetyltransferase/amino-acid acetyltransferase ArgJ [Natroniella sulfidigena]MCK8817987.1 bifunctional glutamate N-acetyltransferase/amino-acid acetyltransferase ArgJ [Natroniella sulfidigena]